MYNKQVQIAPGVYVVYTMSSTLLVPDREIPCTQWVSFTGDNEPVLNTSPEVDDSCDTFLRRLQRSKLYTQNDPSLPTGQQFCFEAMVDKRYNRWKRRRRKKQSEAKRASVVHASDSSDENDERTEAMERIIDRMYEEIHGPVPQTPNGSRDTPRVRNRRRRRDINSLRKTPDDDVQEQDSSVSLYDASSEWQSDVSLQSSSSVQQIESTAAGEQKVLQNSPSKSASDDLCSWPYLEHYKSEILKRLQSTPPDHLEDLEQNDWLPNIDDMNYDSEEGGDVCCEDTDNICSLDFSNADDVKQNENTFECQDICKEITSIAAEDSATELTPDEYEPYICISETPCQSPVQESVENQQHKAIQTKVKCPVDVSEQVYPCSYTKWSRSQTSETKKICSFESKPKPLSRTSTPSCSLIYCDPDTRENNRDTTKSTRDTRENIRDTRENTIDIIENTSDTRENTRNTKENTRGTRENKRDPSENTRDTRDNTRDTRENRSTDKIPFRQIKQPEFVQRSKERQAKKSKKVALNINKQIVNLPSLTKTSRSQTIPRPSTKGSFESTDRSLKVKVKPTKSFEESHRTQSTLQVTQTKGSLKGSQTVPDLTLKDYYLRTLYGYKTRINSHVDDSNKHKGLKKTLTVDNLELLGKRTRKKSEMAKPNDLAFTRSFTFSMFDLPEVYKLYNTNLERTATGEEIEIQL